MNDILKENYIAYINSYKKLVSTDSTFNFTVMINLPKNNNFNKVVVLQMSIPKSYYLVQNGYNTFHIYEPDNGLNHLVTIPFGNYTRSLFMAQLGVSIGTAVPPCSGSYSITFSSSTGKFTYSVSGAVLQPSIKTTSNLFEQLGFTSNSTNTFVGGIIESTTCIKLQLEDTLFVLSDCSNALSGVLQEVYCNSSDFSNITFSQYNEEMYSKTFIRNNNNVFRFSITDENFRPMDLNGLNMNMTLCFYREEPKTIELPSETVVAPPSNMYVAEAPPLPKATLKSTTDIDGVKDKNIEDNTLFA